MCSSDEVRNIEEALQKLVCVFHKTYGGRDENGKYLIDDAPHTGQEVMMMGNCGNCIVNS